MSHLRPHPYCVRYYQAWEQKGYLYIQMELCEMGSLKDYLEELDGPLPEKQIWRYLYFMTRVRLLRHQLYLSLS